MAHSQWWSLQELQQVDQRLRGTVLCVCVCFPSGNVGSVAGAIRVLVPPEALHFYHARHGGHVGVVVLQCDDSTPHKRSYAKYSHFAASTRRCAVAADCVF